MMKGWRKLLMKPSKLGILALEAKFSEVSKYEWNILMRKSKVCNTPGVKRLEFSKSG